MTERLPGKTLHFSLEPLKTASQAREIAADAEVLSPFVAFRAAALQNVVPA